MNELNILVVFMARLKLWHGE